jgi:hypothetical protein
MRWAGHVARMVKIRKAYAIYLKKTEGKRTVGRPVL